MPLLHKTQNPCHTFYHGRQERRNQEASFSLLLLPLLLLVPLLTQKKNYVPPWRSRLKFGLAFLTSFTSSGVLHLLPSVSAFPNSLPQTLWPSVRGSRMWPKFTLGIHAALTDSPLTSIYSSTSLVNLMSGKCWFLWAWPTKALVFLCKPGFVGLCCWPKCYHVLNWFFLPKPGFLEFIWIFSDRNHFKINISHILNPNLT